MDRCDSCGVLEEKLEGFDAPKEHACPKCGLEAGMKRQISRAAFNLAGGGWHSQGYSVTTPEKKTQEAEPSPAPKTGCAGGCACHSPAKDN